MARQSSVFPNIQLTMPKMRLPINGAIPNKSCYFIDLITHLYHLGHCSLLCHSDGKRGRVCITRCLVTSRNLRFAQQYSHTRQDSQLKGPVEQCLWSPWVKDKLQQHVQYSMGNHCKNVHPVMAVLFWRQMVRILTMTTSNFTLTNKNIEAEDL